MFVPDCEPDSVTSVHLHGFDEVRMHPCDHPLHRKVLKNFIYYYGSLIQSEMVLCLIDVIVVVVCFVPSCEPDSAS